MASTCWSYRLHSPVRSYLKHWYSRVSQPQDREQSCRQSSMESQAVSKLFPHLSGPAVVHVQEEKQWETSKIALEESSETSTCAPPPSSKSRSIRGFSEVWLIFLFFFISLHSGLAPEST